MEALFSATNKAPGASGWTEVAGGTGTPPPVEGGRDEVIQMANIFRAKIIDVSRETLTVAIFGDKEKTAALTGMLADFGILEIAKTGTIAIERGRSTIYDDNKLKEEYNYGKNVL